MSAITRDTTKRNRVFEESCDYWTEKYSFALLIALSTANGFHPDRRVRFERGPGGGSLQSSAFSTYECIGPSIQGLYSNAHASKPDVSHDIGFAADIHQAVETIHRAFLHIVAAAVLVGPINAVAVCELYREEYPSER